jgi:hypothetical protein
MLRAIEEKEKMRTLLIGTIGSLVALVGFASTANASATVDLLWGGTTATLTGTAGASSTTLVLAVVLTAGATPNPGASIDVDYSSAAGGKLVFVAAGNTTFTQPLTIQLGAPVDTGTSVLGVNNASLGAKLLAGQSFLLGTITFHKGLGAGTFSITSSGLVGDNTGGVDGNVTFNSATLNQAAVAAAVPEPGTVSLLALGLGGLALASRRKN